MLAIFLRTAIQLLAGLGIGKAMDTFVRPKVPATYYPDPIIENKPAKLALTVVVFAAGIVLAKWIGKKMKISILK
jgi:hypothetical protein